MYEINGNKYPEKICIHKRGDINAEEIILSRDDIKKYDITGKYVFANFVDGGYLFRANTQFHVVIAHDGKVLLDEKQIRGTKRMLKFGIALCNELELTVIAYHKFKINDEYSEEHPVFTFTYDDTTDTVTVRLLPKGRYL